MRFIDEVDLMGKKVLVRVDFNVPLKNGDITDDTRIRESLPTLQYALDKGAALVLCSHLGKPKGVDPALSLAPAARRLQELLGRSVIMAPDCLGPEVARLARDLEPGGVLVLENLRFHAGEKANDPAMGRELAALVDIYCNDAFGTAHRAHASTEAVARFARACCGGLLLKKEWKYLGKTLADPKRPYVAVSGGAKVSSKLTVLHRLLDKVDGLIIGGAMANTFLLAQGFNMARSLVESDRVDDAKAIMIEASRRNVPLFLPVDGVLAGSPDAPEPVRVTDMESIPPDQMILDIGPKTVEAFARVLGTARTVVWNGPMGAFENPAFAHGTLEIARAMGGLGADVTTIVGGGDSVAAVQQAGLAGSFSFLSTGGGSFLEFMEGRELPAFKALEEC